VDKMIDEIIEEFNFAKVQDTMIYLNWRWCGNIVTYEMLREKAIYLLQNAAENRLGQFKSENWELGSTNSTGGLRATAYCNEEKTKINKLELEFILESWETAND
ncbi:MAG: hypothetical protein ACR2IJ_07730, partial [Fluviibacter sp.]